MSKLDKILLLLAAVLMVGCGYFAYKYQSTVSELNAARTVLEARHYNEKAGNFLRMFVQKVIKADKEISFDTRLELENAVRDLKDGEVLAVWQKFVNSKNEVDAQSATKDLLELLSERACAK